MDNFFNEYSDNYLNGNIKASVSYANKSNPNKPADVNDTDAIINMLNNIKAQGIENTQEIQKLYYFAYRNSTYNIIDIEVKRSIYQEQKEEKKRIQKLKIKLISIILAASFVLGYGGHKIKEQQNIRLATEMAREEAKEELLSLLAEMQGSITFSNEAGTSNLFSKLSTSDYAKLTVDDIGQIYSYKLVLGDAEFEDFIKSLIYLENGEERHYISFRQFLNINGYGSEEEFINSAEAILLNQYNSEHHKGKGGK